MKLRHPGVMVLVLQDDEDTTNNNWSEDPQPLDGQRVQDLRPDTIKRLNDHHFMLGFPHPLSKVILPVWDTFMARHRTRRQMMAVYLVPKEHRVPANQERSVMSTKSGFQAQEPDRPLSQFSQ